MTLYKTPLLKLCLECHWEVRMKTVGEELSRTWGSTIAEAIEDALDDWHEAEAKNTRHLKRTRASYLWDCAIAKLRAVLGPSRDFFFHDVGQTTYIVYKQLLRLQLKGLNSQGRISSVPTGRVRRFTSQLPLGFEDDKQFTNVFLAYQLDPYEVSVQSVVLACPSPSGYKWVVPVEPDVSHSADLFTGAAPSGNGSAGGRLRLRIKKDAEAEDGSIQ